MKDFLLLFSTIIFFQSCAFKPESSPSTSVPSAPDYSNINHWASYPSKADPADLVPKGLGVIDQNLAADVFYLHPTTYYGKGVIWNAPLSDQSINDKTDSTAIKFQASIFNSAGRVYAPRYRQAHLSSFYEMENEDSKLALDVAYQDVRAAFKYYLENENKGRPIILAAHSQGAFHARRLLLEFFDNKKLQEQLVVAYLVGWPILKEEFKNIEPCKVPEEVGCFCSWRTFKNGYMPKKFTLGDSIAVSNPLSWKNDGSYVPKTANKGGVLLDFDKVLVHLADAQVTNGILWTNKPRFPGSFLFTRRNYHIADLNFYYLNVKENARQRLAAYLDINGK